MKKSSSQFFGNKSNINRSNNNNFNKQDKSNNQTIKNLSQKNSLNHMKNIRKIPVSKLNYNIRSININSSYNNKALNSSNFIYKNNIKTKSVPKDNRRVRTIFNNKNGNNSFVSNKRVKTPILNRNENSNMRVINNYKDLSKNRDNKMNKKNMTSNFSINMHENKSFRNYNNIFHPVNIFSQFKKNKPINNEDLANKNSQLFKKFLNEEQKQNIINDNNIHNNNIYNKNYTPNLINNTNDTTPISSGNLLNNKSNSNQNLNVNNKVNKIVFDKNIDCHEINFHVNGISSSTNLKNNFKPKKKIFKGKKIKCMHDLSKTGLSGDDKKVNQDNYFIFKNFVQGFDNIFMGVCDGHGYYGHEVSGYIKENLPMDLNHLIKTKKLNVLTDDLSSTIKTAFVLENKSLLRNRQIDSDLSGSTCISTIYTPQKLIIANIGDSRCVLGKCIEKENFEEKDEIVGEKNKKNVRWLAVNLSRDHKPTIPEEAERILKVGGRIRPMKDEDGEYIGPMRVYMKDKDMRGLAMTRSFGDYFGSTAGVISEPEVSEYVFKPEDKFIVLASDGLFEFMESQEVVDIIKDYYEKNDIVGCCEYLYKESTRKWIQEEEDTIDDITIILVFFEDLYEEIEE
jgi:serine/threonine protein phosphatase PrpC